MEKTILSHGRVIQTLALFEELVTKRTKYVILVLCVSAMFLDTKYSICVSNKYVINEKQSYLTDVVKACHTYGKLPPICDFFNGAKSFVAVVWLRTQWLT